MKFFFLTAEKFWISFPKILQWAFVGVLLGFGFIFPIFWWTVIPGIILFFHTSQGTSRIRNAWLGGWIAWSTKSLFALGFLFDTLPLEWLGVNNWWLEHVVVLFGWLWGGVSLGVGGALLAAVLFYIRKYYTPKPLWLVLICTIGWLPAEWLSSVMYSLMTSGPGSFIQGYFSFGYVGYLFGLTQLGLILASFWGVYGLTLLLASLCSLLWYIGSRKQYLLLVLFVTAFVSFPFLSKLTRSGISGSVQGITIDAINTTYQPFFLDSKDGQQFKFTIVNRAVESSLKLNPDYLLLPEDSRFLNSVYPAISFNQSLAKFKFLHGTSKTMIIDSSRTVLPNGNVVARAELFSGQYGAPTYTYDKQYLVPGGEFIPYVFRILMKITGFSQSIVNQTAIGNYEPGPLLQQGNIDPDVPGVLFCFESIRPDGVRSLMKKRTPPKFIVHPISHAWFHQSKILWQQQDVMLSIQARWQGVSIVSAGNMMQGKLYLPSGQIDNGEVIENGEGWNITRFEF